MNATADQFKVCTFYARFSPRPDADKSISNAEQLCLTKEWCHEQQLPLPTLCFEDKKKSRDDMNRPGLWDCVKATQGGLMVAYSLDRVGDIIAIETVVRMLEKQKSTLATVVEGVQSNDPDNEFLRIIKGGLSRQQKRHIARLTADSYRIRVARGECMGRYAPAGFKFVLWEGTTQKTRRGLPKRRVVPDYEEIKIIRQIQRIARDLDMETEKCYSLETLVNRLGFRVRGKEVTRRWLQNAMKLDLRTLQPVDDLKVVNVTRGAVEGAQSEAGLVAPDADQPLVREVEEPVGDGPPHLASGAA